MNILFICSQNKWRSPTAEHIFARYLGIQTRSAGTSNNARIKINQADLNWADIIMAMENKHKAYITRKFSALSKQKTIIVLHIPDKYQYMDEKLVEILKSKMAAYLPEID